MMIYLNCKSCEQLLLSIQERDFVDFAKSKSLTIIIRTNITLHVKINR